MKMTLLTLTFVFAGISAFAEEQAAPAQQAQPTEAGWFSPSCKDCPKLQTPGSANLGNTKGVYRPGGKKKKPVESAPVKTDQ